MYLYLVLLAFSVIGISVHSTFIFLSIKMPITSKNVNLDSLHKAITLRYLPEILILR